MSSTRPEATQATPMERVTVGTTKALRLYDSGGKTGPIEIGGVGRKGLFYVRLQEGDLASGMLNKNPGIFTAEGELLEEHVCGVTALDLVTLLHDGYNKSGRECLAYYKDFREGADGAVKFRAVFRSPLMGCDDERFFETDLEVFRFPAELFAGGKRARVD